MRTEYIVCILLNITKWIICSAQFIHDYGVAEFYSVFRLFPHTEFYSVFRLFPHYTQIAHVASTRSFVWRTMRQYRAHNCDILKIIIE